MRFLNKFSLLTVLSFGTSTYAQAPDPTAGSGSTTGSATVSGSATVTISPGDMAARASALQAQAKDDHQHVLHLQMVARKNKDVIKLNCINDRLVQMKAQLNIFDAAHSSLTASGANAQASFDELSIAADSVKRIRNEADVCAGEDLLRQESSTTVDAPDIPDDPTTWDPEWDPSNDDVEPPGYASPFA